MLRYEELQHLSEDRARQLRREADAERLLRPAPHRPQRRRPRLALGGAFALFVRLRRAT
jgi:hypothetical protein